MSTATFIKVPSDRLTDLMRWLFHEVKESSYIHLIHEDGNRGENSGGTIHEGFRVTCMTTGIIAPDGGENLQTTRVQVQAVDNSCGNAFMLSSFRSLQLWTARGNALETFYVADKWWDKIAAEPIRRREYQKGCVYCGFVEEVRWEDTPFGKWVRRRDERRQGKVKWVRKGKRWHRKEVKP